MGAISPQSMQNNTVIYHMLHKDAGGVKENFCFFAIKSKNLESFKSEISLGLDAALDKFCVVIERGEGEPTAKQWENLGSEYGIERGKIKIFERPKKFTDMV